LNFRDVIKSFGLSRHKASFSSRQELGKWGEDQAVRHLKKNGYRILKRNFRALGGEIDVVATKDEILVFVEVKTQDGIGTISPDQRIGYRKQKQISKVAKFYLSRTKGNYDEVRLDVIAVTRLDEQVEIEHIEGAFGATE
jgi:putative endonuclease